MKRIVFLTALAAMMAAAMALCGVAQAVPTPGPNEDKQVCKKGGYEILEFKNQGQCIKAVNANN
jgi:hypothetical protein